MILESYDLKAAHSQIKVYSFFVVGRCGHLTAHASIPAAVYE